jgi:hypothetical protein
MGENERSVDPVSTDQDNFASACVDPGSDDQAWTGNEVVTLLMGISRNTLCSRVAGGVVTLLSVAAIGAPARAVVINVRGVNWDISAAVVSPGTKY